MPSTIDGNTTGTIRGTFTTDRSDLIANSVPERYTTFDWQCKSYHPIMSREDADPHLDAFLQRVRAKVGAKTAVFGAESGGVTRGEIRTALDEAIDEEIEMLKTDSGVDWARQE